jgi:hypothetical protein
MKVFHASDIFSAGKACSRRGPHHVSEHMRTWEHVVNMEQSKGCKVITTGKKRKKPDP